MVADCCYRFDREAFLFRRGCVSVCLKQIYLTTTGNERQKAPERSGAGIKAAAHMNSDGFFAFFLTLIPGRLTNRACVISPGPS